VLFAALSPRCVEKTQFLIAENVLVESHYSALFYHADITENTKPGEYFVAVARHLLRQRTLGNVCRENHRDPPVSGLTILGTYINIAAPED